MATMITGMARTSRAFSPMACARKPVVTPAAMRRLNRHFRGKDKPTNVLSFPSTVASGVFPQPLGDIVVSVDRAMEQAREGRGGEDGATRNTPADELRLLVVHGALHLCGWDHRGPQAQTAMWSEQRRILRAHARAKP